jgi:hypothetical protein
MKDTCGSSKSVLLSIAHFLQCVCSCVVALFTWCSGMLASAA